jgi:putative cardiolipin synthase
VIESPELASELARVFDRATAPDVSYQVVLANGTNSSSSKLLWLTTVAGKELRLKEEPGTTWFKRFKLKIMRILPIESQI